MGEVHADLVRAAGLELHAQQRVAAETLLDAIVRHRLPPVAPHRHARAHRAMPADGLVDGGAGGGPPEAEGQIAARDLAFLQQAHQLHVHLRRARHHQQAARILVEAMNQTGARHHRQRRIMRQQRILQGVARIAGTGMHDQAGRLVDHQQGLVLIGDAQADRLGFNGRLGRKFRLDAHPLAAGQAFPRSHHAAIEQDRTAADPALQPRARVLRQGGGERQIKARAGGLGRQLEFMDAELGVHGAVAGAAGLIRYTGAFAS